MYQVFYRALTNISCGKRRRRRQPETSRSNNGDDSNAADKSQSLPLLYGLSRSWAWNAITFRCQTHPQEVSELFADELGETILHWACLGKPPVESIQAILNICPQMAQSRNKAGHLPLHGTVFCFLIFQIMY